MNQAICHNPLILHKHIQSPLTDYSFSKNANAAIKMQGFCRLMSTVRAALQPISEYCICVLD